MKKLAVGRRYAKALLLIGKEDGQAETYKNELDGVARLIEGNKNLDQAINNPLYVPRIVGRIAGLFEYVEGQEADIRYSTPEPQVLEVEIRSA